MSSFYLFRPHNRIFLPTTFVLITAFAAVGQSSQPSTSASPPSNSPSPSGSVAPSKTPSGGGQPAVKPAPVTANGSSTSNQPPAGRSASAQSSDSSSVVIMSSAVQVTATDDTAPVNPTVRKIERARALAAAHQLQQAVADLENVRASVNDVALRNVTTLMLIGIYLEEGNYVRAQALLEEAFQARAAQKDESLRTYFAMAGQTINGLRAHLARYRSFGINTSEQGLPPEANTDLDRVRNVLERVAAQAKEISNEAGRSYDAVALQEDVVGIRLSLARDTDDRAKWQTEYIMIREKLASSQAQVPSIGRSALLDAVTARIPNPFAAKPTVPDDSSANSSTPPGSTGAVAAMSESANASDKAAPQLISTGSLSGRESKRVTPTYPAMARTAGVSGTVRVFAIVDENGRIWVTNSEGPALLRKAAEEAAKNWTFPPSQVSGRPVRIAGYLDFDFKQ